MLKQRDVISGSVVARHNTCRRPSEVVVGEQEFALRAIEVATWDALGGIGVLDGAVVIGVYPAASSMASLGCDNSRRARGAQKSSPDLRRRVIRRLSAHRRLPSRRA